MPSPLILYATMTGNAKDAADLLRQRLAGAGHDPRVEEMRSFDPRRLADEQVAFLLTSTFGNGEPPDSAFAFWDILRKADGLGLGNLSYSVAAFGDSTYPRFCQYGADLDRRLEILGARRLCSLRKLDVDWEEDFEAWMDQALGALPRT